MEWLERTALLIGSEEVERLSQKHVLVVGLGGVGAYAAEQIVRAGVGELTIADGDSIHITNLNRQLPALHSTLGQSKVECLAQRFLDINPKLTLHVVNRYLRPEDMPALLEPRFNHVVDAIDTLAPKISLIVNTLQRGYPLVSSMGSGAKLDPSLVRIADIAQSHTCPLARMLRKRLHQQGVTTGFQVVFSSEAVPPTSLEPCINEPNKKTTVGTMSYMPPLFGCMAASVVIRDLLAQND